MADWLEKNRAVHWHPQTESQPLLGGGCLCGHNAAWLAELTAWAAASPDAVAGLNQALLDPGIVRAMLGSSGLWKKFEMRKNKNLACLARD